MGLRDLAASHRSQIIGSESFGCGEDVICYPATSEPFTVKGVWRESRSDQRAPIGIGAEGHFSNTTLTISISDAQLVTRAWTFKRVSTGETCDVEQVTMQTGIGWQIQLTRADRARVTGVR